MVERILHPAFALGALLTGSTCLSRPMARRTTTWTQCPQSSLVAANNAVVPPPPAMAQRADPDTHHAGDATGHVDYPALCLAVA